MKASLLVLILSTQLSASYASIIRWEAWEDGELQRVAAEASLPVEALERAYFWLHQRWQGGDPYKLNSEAEFRESLAGITVEQFIDRAGCDMLTVRNSNLIVGIEAQIAFLEYVSIVSQGRLHQDAMQQWQSLNELILRVYKSPTWKPAWFYGLVAPSAELITGVDVGNTRRRSALAWRDILRGGLRDDLNADEHRVAEWIKCLLRESDTNIIEIFRERGDIDAVEVRNIGIALQGIIRARAAIKVLQEQTDAALQAIMTSERVGVERISNLERKWRMHAIDEVGFPFTVSTTEKAVK